MLDNILFKRNHFRRLLILAVFALLFLPARLFAKDISVSAVVDKNDITLEDYILLSLSVKGTRAEPLISEVPYFRVQARGSSSQVSIVNGQMSSTVVYNYILYPEKKGSYTIGPFYLKGKGKRIESNTIRINVQKSSSSTTASKDVFVVAEVDNDHPHIYEQIIYTFKFCRAVKVANANLTETPAFDGFVKQDLGKEKEYQKVINGRPFIITEIKYALFPTKTGVIEITPSTLQCSVVVQKRRSSRSPFNNSFFDDSFFGFTETVPKMLRTGSVTIRVQPLPFTGKPDGFKNRVGVFKLTSSLSSVKVEKGESITLTLTVSGTGNLKNNQDIKVGGLQNFKVYDDKPVFESKIINGKAGGTLVIKKALVPLVEGTLNIPEISLSFYNPESEAYEKAVTGPYSIEVLPPKVKEKFEVIEGVNSLANKKDVKILGKDILPVYTGVNALINSNRKMLSVFNLFLFFAPFVFYLAAFIYNQKFKNREEDAGLARKKNAYKQFKKNISFAGQKLGDEGPSFFQLSQKALKDFIGDSFRVPGNALTSNEIQEMLVSEGFPSDVVEQVKTIMLFCDSGQFGSEKYSLKEKEEIFELMKKCAAFINKRLRK